MNLDDIEEALMGQNVTGTEALVAVALLLIGGGLAVLAGRLLRRWVRRLNQDVIPGEATDVGVRLTQVLVLGVFLSWALSVLGANHGWITFFVVAILVIGAITLKPYVAALASTVAVASRSAFSVGDEIEVDGVLGEVERLTNRSTVVRTRDGRRVHIPNAELVDMTVTVYTAYPERRSTIELALALETDLDQADQVIRKALAAVAPVHRIGSIRARSFGEGVNLSLRFWHGPRLMDAAEARDATVRTLKVAFEQSGIGFAPSSSIHIESSLNTSYVEDGDGADTS